MCTQLLFQLLLLHAIMSSGRLVILNYPIVVVYWEDNLVYCLREDLNLYYVISLENLIKHVSWFLEIVMPHDQHQCCILLWRGRENNLRPFRKYPHTWRSSVLIPFSVKLRRFFPLQQKEVFTSLFLLLGLPLSWNLVQYQWNLI